MDSIGSQPRIINLYRRIRRTRNIVYIYLSVALPLFTMFLVRLIRLGISWWIKAMSQPRAISDGRFRFTVPVSFFNSFNPTSTWTLNSIYTKNFLKSISASDCSNLAELQFWSIREKKPLQRYILLNYITCKCRCR